MQTDFCSWLSNPAALQGESLSLGTPRYSKKRPTIPVRVSPLPNRTEGGAAKKPQGFFVGIARAVLLSALEALEELNLASVIEVVRGDAVDVVHIIPDRFRRARVQSGR